MPEYRRSLEKSDKFYYSQCLYFDRETREATEKNRNTEDNEGWLTEKIPETKVLKKQQMHYKNAAHCEFVILRMAHRKYCFILGLCQTTGNSTNLKFFNSKLPAILKSVSKDRIWIQI